MKKKHTKTPLVRDSGGEEIIYKKKMRNPMTKAQWARFDAMKDEDIDLSDIPEITPEQWKNARIVRPQKKKAISMRLDEDILKWFKKQGRGYQSFMNAVLRSYYESHLVVKPK